MSQIVPEYYCLGRSIFSVLLEKAPQTTTARRHEPLRDPLSEVRSTVTELDRQQRWDGHRQRSEAARQRASQRPTTHATSEAPR